MTVAPVAGLAVLVGNGQHQQVGAVLRVHHAVGKTAQAAAADLLAAQAPAAECSCALGAGLVFGNHLGQRHGLDLAAPVGA